MNDLLCEVDPYSLEPTELWFLSIYHNSTASYVNRPLWLRDQYTRYLECNCVLNLLKTLLHTHNWEWRLGFLTTQYWVMQTYYCLIRYRYQTWHSKLLHEHFHFAVQLQILETILCLYYWSSKLLRLHDICVLVKFFCPWFVWNVKCLVIRWMFYGFQLQYWKPFFVCIIGALSY